MEYLSGIDFAVKDLDAMGSIEGYASTFKNIDRQGDRVVRGAFKETLEETGGKFPLLMGHNTGRIIGFATHAEEDSHGLRISGQLTLDADEGRNAYATAKHAHALRQPIKMSIGYGVREGGSAWDDKTRVRTLSALDLYEVSFVAVPANPRAQVTAVKNDVVHWTIRELEEHLRDVGFPSAAAKTIAAAGLTALGSGLTDQRDVDGGEIGGLFAVAREVVSVNSLKEILRCQQAQ